MAPRKTAGHRPPLHNHNRNMRDQHNHNREYQANPVEPRTVVGMTTETKTVDKEFEFVVSRFDWDGGEWVLYSDETLESASDDAPSSLDAVIELERDSTALFLSTEEPGSESTISETVLSANRGSFVFTYLETPSVSGLEPVLHKEMILVERFALTA